MAGGADRTYRRPSPCGQHVHHPDGCPGISITPIITQGGERTNAVFLDNVTIPAAQRIGAENGGRAAITAALNYERMFYHNEPRWELRQLAEWATGAGLLTGDGADAFTLAEVMGEHAVDVEICRLFALRGADMLAHGRFPTRRPRPNLIGEDGTIATGSEHAPAHGHLDHGLRSSPVWRFGGGTNEVQLDIIAQRGLGCPLTRVNRAAPAARG